MIGTAGAASLIRIMRATLLDDLAKQYVITARAKGVSERRLLFRTRCGWQSPGGDHRLAAAGDATLTAMCSGTARVEAQDMFLAPW